MQTVCLVASAPRRTASCAKLKQDQFAWKVVLTLDPEIASPRNLLMEEFKFEANVRSSFPLASVAEYDSYQCGTG